MAGASGWTRNYAVHLFPAKRGIDLDPVSVELTYGLDRICAYLQGVDSVYNMRWSEDRTYGQVRLLEEQEFSAYNFEYADPAITRKLFELHEKEAAQLLEAIEKWHARSQEAVSAAGRI